VTFDEEIDDALDSVDFRVTLGPSRGPGGLLGGGRVLAAGDIAQGLLRPFAGRGEVDRRVRPEGQLLRQAVGAIANRP
jgi:hypothetical protein